MQEIKVEYVSIDKIKPYQRNARKHDSKSIEVIANSISEFGMADPIAVWGKENIVIEGHGRLLALKQLGYDKAPIIHLDYLTDEQRRAYTLAHNKTAEFSEWDMELLTDEAESIFNIDLSDFGFDLSDEEEEETEVIEDEVPEEVEPIAKQGDIWQLGRYRLMCGDSTSVTDVEKLMNGNKADMVFTDPPYGIDYSGGRSKVVRDKEYGKLKNDDLKGEELGNLICNVFNFNKKEADVYICVSPIMQKPFLDYIEQRGKELNAVIVWDKKQPGLGYMAYRRQCEFILFVKGKPFKKGDTTDFDLWSISRDDATTYVHGTQKPVGVSARAIKNSSKQDDNVLDFFGGSGSTLIACEQLNRKCFMMELDQHYVDVIIARWEKFTGQKAVLLNGE